MHRAILEACFPYFLWMLAGFAGLWLVLRISGGRMALTKLRGLHRCQEGGVQTLSFVLTLPIFMMIVLFVVQVSQLMIGITVVHYAAFAAARAASVWIAAELPYEPANNMGSLAIAEEVVSYPDWYTTQKTNFNTISPAEKQTVAKYYRIWSAAALACMPIAPSHQYMTPSAMQQIGAQNGVTVPMTTLYQSLVPKSGNNPQIANRLRNKAAYAFDHTMIVISGTDVSLNGVNGPTYNPVDHPPPTDQFSPEPIGTPQTWLFRRSEIGWQDPITVKVNFDFPLLTGPGRFLSPGKFMSTKLSPADGTPDKVSNRILIWDKKDHSGYSESVYFTILTASATVTNEGMKSIIAFPEKWDWLMQ